MLTLNDIYDLFLASIQEKSVRLEFATYIGVKFNINKDEVYNILINNKPNFEKKSNEIICGRVKLSIKQLNSNQMNQSSLM